MRFSTAELATHLGGSLVGPDVTVDGAGIDSRTIAPGQLFVPIVAERDGHAFIGAALGRRRRRLPHPGGARRGHRRRGGGHGHVRSCTSACWPAAASPRAWWGSRARSGKTTTKDLLRHCLASTFRTAASERSFNNELGLPLTLLNAPDDTQWVVLEMGARGVGHIAQLAAGGTARRRDRDQRGHGPRRVLRGTRRRGPGQGRAGPGAYPRAAWPSSTSTTPEWPPWPRSAPAPCSATRSRPTPRCGPRRWRSTTTCGPRFTLVTPWGKGEVRLSLHGLQQVPNALAAADRRAVVRCASRGRAGGAGRGHGFALPHGGAPAGRRPAPTGRLLQRQPGLDRSGAAHAGRRPFRTQAGPPRADGRTRRGDRGRAPAHGGAGRGVGHRGRRLPDRSLRRGPRRRRGGRGVRCSRRSVPTMRRWSRGAGWPASRTSCCASSPGSISQRVRSRAFCGLRVYV